MRIAQVSPFWEEVTVESEGAEGQTVAQLARSLVRVGHDVTVFASADSCVTGTLVGVAPRALRHYAAPKRHLAEGLTLLALEKALSSPVPFDVIHVHAGFTAFPLMRRSTVPVVATVYGALDMPEVAALYREFKELPLVATSSEQLRLCPDLNWQALIPLDSSQDGGTTHPEPSIETAVAYTAVYEKLFAVAASFRRPSVPRHVPSRFAETHA